MHVGSFRWISAFGLLSALQLRASDFERGFTLAIILSLRPGGHWPNSAGRQVGQIRNCRAFMNQAEDHRDKKQSSNGREDQPSDHCPSKRRILFATLTERQG